MAGSRKLTLQIFGNAKSAVKALGETGSAAVGMGSKVASALPSLKTIGIAGAAAFASVAAGAYKAVQAAAEDQKSFKLLESQLKSTVGATDAQVAGVERQIGAMMRATGIADDKLRPAFANLVRGTNSVADSQQLMQVALDVSAGTGKDLESVSVALSKAYGGNMMALSRLGIPLDENIKKSKDSKGALEQLSKTFAGQADVAADTFSGRLQIMKTGLGEVTESVGYALLPALTASVGFITDKVMPALGGFSDALSTGGLEGGLRFLATNIKESAPKVISALLDFIKMAGEWIRSTGLPLFVEYLQFLATAITGWIKPRIPMIIEQVKQFVKSMVDWLLNTGLPFLVEKVQKLGDALVGWISEAAREIPPKLVTFLGEIGQWLLTNAVPKLAELGGKLLYSLTKWVFQLGGSLIIGLGGAIVALVAALPDLFKGFFVGLGKIAVAAVKFFMDKFSDLARAIGQLAIGAVNFLIEQFNKIPIVPNIPLITLDLKKATTQMGLTAAETKAVSTGMKSFSDAADSAKNSSKGLSTGIDGLNLSLGGGAGGAGGGAKKATDDAKKALETYITAMRAATSASKAVADAQKAVTKSQSDLLKATAAVADAQKKFDLITKGYGKGSKKATDAERERAKAQRDLERAGYGLEGAVKAVKDAETKLADLRKDPATTPEMIREAEIALAEAKLSVADATDAQIEATEGLAKAETLLDEIVNGAKEGSETYTDALKQLTEAKDREVEATDRVTEAIERETEAKQKLADAERELLAVRKKTADSVEAEGDAIIGGKTPVTGGGSGIIGLPTQAELDQIGRIGRGDFSGIDFGNITIPSLEDLLGGGLGVPMATGGIVTRPTSIIAGERGAEAIIPLDRLGGMGTEINITVNAGMGTDGQMVGNEIVRVLKQYERLNGYLPLTAAATI